MPFRAQTLMDGTTLCPHCDTRFKIIEAQLEAHNGMVRCGHCLHAFDARPGFIPDQPSPQLELPILSEPTAQAAESPATPDIPEPVDSLPETHSDENLLENPASLNPALQDELPDNAEFIPDAHDLAQPPAHSAAFTSETEPLESNASAPSEAHAEPTDHEPPAFNPTNATPDQAEPAALIADDALLPLTKTLAEQIAVSEDGHDEAYPAKPNKWPWAMGAILCLLLLIGQAAYFFRVDVAARLPGLKPALIAYCQLLKCTVPLPRKSELMSIESSDLAADPALENQITLNALLRNRATFSQAFPYLELTLNDTQDKPLARRLFKPSDYLPPIESENFGLLPNHEIGIKLHLDVTDLKPTGYRLVLFYPAP